MSGGIEYQRIGRFAMRSTNCRGLWLIMVVLINLYIAPVTLAQGRPLMVNLAPYQTPIKNQGSRTTCITFASIAGLEAAYKHAGYGDLDLSEQFLRSCLKRVAVRSKGRVHLG